MFVPDMMTTNAYRALGLSGNATASEIHKAAASLRRVAVLGLAGTTAADLPQLGEVPRTEADIRTALGRLENPEQRLNDRLFWFHLPPESRDVKARAQTTEATLGQTDGAAWEHDEALHGLYVAFEAGVDDAGVRLWVQALRVWHQVVSDDDYWALTLTLEEQGGFEPAALPSEIDALRENAVRLAGEALMVAGRDALARNDGSTVGRILDTLGELTDTGPWAALAQEDIAAPAVERFRALCGTVQEEFGSKIVREQDSPESNKSLCDAALKQFRGEIEPALQRVIQLVPPDHEAAQQSREAAALCLSGIATDYTWADDFITSEKLHEEALNLAHNTLGAIRIEERLAQIRVERLRALCGAVRQEFGSKIVREQDSPGSNKSLCDAALKQFRGEIEPALQRVIQLLPPDHEAAQRSREAAALCLSGIATDYTWADDFITSEKLHEEALSLAQNTLSAVRIEDGLKQVREAARKQRVFGALKPISSAPSLRTINGFGFMLYGNSDHDADTGSYVATYYFVALFIPIIPLARYRIIAEGKQYRFLGKMPLRRGDRWHLGIAITGIVAMILIGMISSSQNPSSPYTPPTSNDSDSAASSPQSSQLSDLKARIESGRSRMTILKTELQPTIEKLTTLNARMDALAAELKSLDEQQKAGLQINISDYNAKVKAYNALLKKRRALIAANRTNLQTYDDLLKQDSVLVDQYNALLR